MAFIVTSKNKARPPITEGGSSVRTRVYDEQIHKQILKDEKELADQRAWESRPYEERTSIALEKMKSVVANDLREQGREVSTEALNTEFAKVAEHRDKTS